MLPPTLGLPDLLLVIIFLQDILNFFKEKGCKTIGVEPTNSAKDSIHFTINSFFDKNTL